jgi:hypothetical protein
MVQGKSTNRNAPIHRGKELASDTGTTEDLAVYPAMCASKDSDSGDEGLGEQPRDNHVSL